MTKKILAIIAKAMAIPVKPNIPAIIAIMKKIIVHFNMMIPLVFLSNTPALAGMILWFYRLLTSLL